MPHILGVSQVGHDYREWRLVEVTGVGGVAYGSPRTGIKTLESLLKPVERLIYGGISATGRDLVTLLMIEILGVDVQIMFGFEGRGPARLAFERGKVNVDRDTTPSYLADTLPSGFIEAENAHVLLHDEGNFLFGKRHKRTADGGGRWFEIGEPHQSRA